MFRLTVNENTTYKDLKAKVKSSKPGRRADEGRPKHNSL